ncbi:MAG: retron system putative HNH endonuclease [Acidobacteriota bacterium]
MIQIDRPPQPADLDDTSELEAVLQARGEHLSSGGAPDTFRFKTFAAYKAKAVKTSLKTAFAGKCAYCECFYSANQPMDVEHWRPKGRVRVDKQTVIQGYYWLAANWDNLLPSCIDCNRSRKQFDVVSGKEIAIGKADQFPLADEATRAPDHEDKAALDREATLLIHPYEDDPERFFAYDDRGAIRPRDGLSAADRQRALTSIDVYALNRSGLVAERLEVIRLIDQRLALIRALAALRNDLVARELDDVAELVASLIDSETRALEERLDRRQPFSGVARYLLAEAAGFLSS